MDNASRQDDLRNAWRVFLLEWELARHYHFPYLLYIASTNRNPLLDELLPSLLYVRLASLLDEILKFAIDQFGLSLPQQGYRDDLNGRINILANNRKLNHQDELHRIRNRRNQLAHRSATSTTWDELEAAIDKVETTIEPFLSIGTRPHLEYFGERSAFQDSPDPEILGIQDFKCGVKENGVIALEFRWSQALYRQD